MHIRKNPVVHQHLLGKRMYSNRDITGDVTFKVGATEFKAHKSVLAALSSKYMAQFYSDYPVEDPVKVKDISATAFEKTLQFFYLDEVELSHKDIEDVLTLTAESLEACYNECFNYLGETLSIDNVCQSYHLAVKYSNNDLIERCERKISLHTEEVFSSDGFLSCTLGDLFNILQLNSLNSKETQIFEAVILWAKNACTGNGLDCEKMENLRKTLTGSNLPGDLLHQIRFGVMTIQEFMNHYKKYKDLFTEDEREEILYTIAKVTDSKPKRFSDEPRDAVYRKWDEKESIECNRILNETRTETFRFNSNKTTFVSDKPILLGGFFCGSLLQRGEKCVMTNVTIVREQKQDHTDRKPLINTTEKLTFKQNQEAFVKLQSPILIKPNLIYEIQIDLKEGVCVKNYLYKEKVVLGKRAVVNLSPISPTFGQITPTFGLSSRTIENFISGSKTTVEFHDTEGLVTRLMVNLCNENDEISL